MYNNRKTAATATPFQTARNFAVWSDTADLKSLILNGNQIAQRQDKSGSGNHQIQAISGQQPILSGIEAIFDGNSDNLRMSHQSSLNLANEFTFFSVFRLRNSPNRGYFFQKGGYTAAIAATASVIGDISVDQTGVGIIALTDAVVNIDKLSILTVVRSDNFVQIRLDGQNVNIPYYADFVAGNNAAAVGIGANTEGTAVFFSGNLNSEILVARRLSEYQIKKIENFLKLRYKVQFF